MIKNGEIVYAKSAVLLSSLERESPIIYAFVLAVFSTVLSYQVSTVLTDLLLGLKRKGEARLSDFGSLLLAQEGSGAAVIRNLVRSEVASRLYMKRPERGPDQQSPGKIKAYVLGKLLLLLAVAPVVNLAAVGVAIERNQTFSFKEAGFGGMALGIDTDLTVRNVNASEYVGECSEHPLKLVHQDEQLAGISICRESQIDFHHNSSVLFNASQARDLTIEIKLTATGIVTTSVFLMRATVVAHHYVNIVVDWEVYRLYDNLTLEQAKLFMNKAEKMILEDVCVPSFNPMKGEERLNRTGRFLTLSRTISQCADPSWYQNNEIPHDFVKAIFPIGSLLTIVNSKQTLVAPELVLESHAMNESDFFPADDLPAIERRGSLISGGWLGICTALSIIVRVVVRFVTNNDIEDGIEILLKEELGLPRHDSMLHVTKRANYRCSRFGEIGLTETDNAK